MAREQREPTYEELVADLDSWMPWRCRSAIEGLRRLGEARAVPELLRVLRAPRPIWGLFPLDRQALSTELLNALGELGDERAILPLVDLLFATRRSEQAASEALCRITARVQRVGPLVGLLGSLPGQAPPTTPQGRLEVEVVRALIRLGGALTVPLVQAVRDQFKVDMLYWGQTLQEQHPDEPDPLELLAAKSAIPAFIQSLAKAGPRARRQVVRGWANLAAYTTEPLFELLRHEQTRVRVWAAEALGQIGGPEVTRRLTEEMARSRPRDEAVTAIALAGVCDTPDLVPPLVRALKHDHSEVRRAAAEALGGLAVAWASEAIGPLRAARAGELDAEARAACDEALRRIAEGVRQLPAELEAAPAPQGSGTELEAAERPAGRGTEPEAVDG